MLRELLATLPLHTADQLYPEELAVHFDGTESFKNRAGDLCPGEIRRHLHQDIVGRVPFPVLVI